MSTATDRPGADRVPATRASAPEDRPAAQSPETLTDARRAVFLQRLRATCNVTRAAAASGLSRRRLYQLRATDPAFAADWEDALHEGRDLLEAELQRRAFEGYPEPVSYRGEQCGEITRYSDRLAMFLMRMYHPERFGDYRRVDYGGTFVLDLKFGIEDAE